MQSLESCSLNIYCRLSVSFSIKAISNWTIRLREKYFLICMNLTCNNIVFNEDLSKANNYNNTKRNHATIVKLIATLKRATTTTDYTYINYYRKTYGEIPLWVLANVLTFGNLSKMFRVFPQSLKSKVSKNFEPLNQHQMEQFLSVLTKYRNVCAHGERLFTYRTVDAIADTPLHKKLSLPQSGNQYEKGKQDLFAVVIAFRYLLPGKDFLEFKRKLIKEIDRVNREVEHISEVELLNKMGFPKNWKNITRYHLN